MHETVSAALQLPNELRANPQVDIDSAILSKKGVELEGFGLLDEAPEVRSISAALGWRRSVGSCFLGNDQDKCRRCEMSVE